MVVICYCYWFESLEMSGQKVWLFITASVGPQPLHRHQA